MVAGLAEISNLLRVYQRLDAVTSTVADLVAQDDSVTTSEMTEIYNVGSTVFAPFPSSGMTTVVSSIQGINNSSGQLQTKVAWSCSNPHGSALVANSTYALPSNIVTNGSAVVVVTVRYTYQPIIGHILFDHINIATSATVRPRLGSSVALPNGCP